jgi:hypothetical protein
MGRPKGEECVGSLWPKHYLVMSPWKNLQRAIIYIPHISHNICSKEGSKAHYKLLEDIITISYNSK